MTQRQEQFEKMLQAIQAEYETTVSKMEKLKAEDKTKTTTYKQLIGDKLRLQNMLSMYRIYGLID
ncbi:MAG: hypothetical protein PUE18_01650 [Firmicutes bacterium]|nr:hypothetical protein [Bacillota bacterium]